MHHIVGVSGGKDSTCLALRLRELNPEIKYTYISTMTGNELPEMHDHMTRLAVKLESPIINLSEPGVDRLLELIRDQRMIPNWRARFCTRMLKIEPTIKYLKEHAPAIHYVGLRADEPERQGIYGKIEGITHAFPLQDWGWGIGEVWEYLYRQSIEIPERTDCALCFFQGVSEWDSLRRNHPDLYQQGVDIEAEIGHTFRSANRDKWPASLSDLRDRLMISDAPKPRARNCYAEDRDLFCRACTL